MSSFSTASSSRGVQAPGDARSYAWIVLGGAISALVVAEVLFRLFIVEFDGRWPSRVHLVYRAQNPDVVIGDSHLYRAFATQDEFADLSRGGTAPGALEIVAEEYFRHLEPGRVIVEAGPQLLRDEMQRGGTQGHERYFGQNRVGLPFVLYVFEPGVSLRARWLFEIPKVIRQTEYERKRKRPGNPIDAALSERMVTRSRQDVLEFTERVIDASRPISGVRESPAYMAYRRMLQRLRERGAEICMLVAPVSPLFERLTSRDVRYIEGSLALRELAVEQDIRYVNHSDLGLSFDATSFIDTDHLTASAAERFAPAAIRACFEQDSPTSRGPG